MEPAIETPRVQLLTRPGCHLCEAARTTVREVAERSGTGWEELSIDTDPALRSRYAEEVPVVLVDGVQRDFWVIDPVRLERLLSE